MLTATPKSFVSIDYRVRGDGLEPMLLDLSNWRETATFEIDGVTYTLQREGLLSGEFQLRSPTAVVARAEKPSAFRSRFELRVDQRSYVLRRAGFGRRGFEVLAGESVIGTIKPQNLFSRKALIDLPAEWSLPAQLFVFWLVVVVWRRDSAAAS